MALSTGLTTISHIRLELSKLISLRCICWIIIHPVDITIHPFEQLWPDIGCEDIQVLKVTMLCPSPPPRQVIPSPSDPQSQQGGRKDHSRVNWPSWMSDQSTSKDKASDEKNGRQMLKPQHLK